MWDRASRREMVFSDLHVEDLEGAMGTAVDLSRTVTFPVLACMSLSSTGSLHMHCPPEDGHQHKMIHACEQTLTKKVILTPAAEWR